MEKELSFCFALGSTNISTLLFFFKEKKYFVVFQAKWKLCFVSAYKNALSLYIHK